MDGYGGRDAGEAVWAAWEGGFVVSTGVKGGGEMGCLTVMGRSADGVGRRSEEASR